MHRLICSKIFPGVTFTGIFPGVTLTGISVLNKTSSKYPAWNDSCCFCHFLERVQTSISQSRRAVSAIFRMAGLAVGMEYGYQQRYIRARSLDLPDLCFAPGQHACLVSLVPAFLAFELEGRVVDPEALKSPLDLMLDPLVLSDVLFTAVDMGIHDPDR